MPEVTGPGGTGGLRGKLRRVPAYVSFRRMQREGFGKAFARERLWRKVLAAPPIRTAHPSRTAIEVHTLCYQWDYLLAIWALKTFYRTSGVDFPLVIHMNGRVGRSMHRRLKSSFPDARLVAQADADAVVDRKLSAGNYVRLGTVQRASPFMLKAVDFHVLATGSTVMGIDSDILFFDRPQDLLERAQRPSRGYVFQRDLQSVYNLSPESARQQFGIELAPCVNTGLMIFPTDLPALSSFERYLTDVNVATPNGFIEQTLYAMHASETGCVDYLPPSYALDLRSGQPYDGLIARHYAGVSRPLMTCEGIPQILERRILSGVTQ